MDFSGRVKISVQIAGLLTTLIEWMDIKITGQQPSLFFTAHVQRWYWCVWLFPESICPPVCMCSWLILLSGHSTHAAACGDVRGCGRLHFLGFCYCQIKDKDKRLLHVLFHLTFKNCINLLTEEIKVSCTITVWPALLKLDPLTLPEKYLKVLYILGVGCIVCLLLLTLSSKEGSVEDLIYIWSSLFILFSCWHHFYFTLTWLLMCLIRGQRDGE